MGRAGTMFIKNLRYVFLVGVIAFGLLALVGSNGGGGGGGGDVPTPTPTTYSISGQATSNGNGLSGVTMTLSGASSSATTTDSDGDYSYSGLSNGSYTVTPSLTGYTFDPVYRDVTISGQNKTGIDFNTSVIEQLPAPQTETISGTVDLPEDCSLDPTELTVRTIAGNKTLGSGGEFPTLAVIDEGLGQIVLVENTSGNTIAVAYLSADDISAGNFTIGSQEMALGLIKLNPYLIVLSPDQEELVLNQARTHSDFSGLVNDIENALVNAPDNALDYETYPYIYQKAVRIGIEVIASFSGTSQSMRTAYANLAAATVGAEEDPHIDDVSGPEITLVNPKQTFYGVDLGNGNDTLLRGRGGILTTNIGWRPPWEWIGTTDPYEKDWDLGDGTFTIIFHKGFNAAESGWLNPFAAPGKATYGNFLKMFGMFMKTAGLFPGLESLSLATLGDAQIQLLLSLDNIPDMDFSDLSQSILEGVDWKDLVFDKLPRYISLHWDDISYWIWQEATAWTSDPQNLMNAADFMHSLGNVLDGMSQAMPFVSQTLTVIEAGNEWIPFFYDLIAAPWKLEYTIRQTNGIITEVSALIPPTASFTIDNQNPAVGETVNFDASDCSDDYDSAASLEVRWDLDGDGTWDTSWTTDKYVSHSYSERGDYRALLEVKDSDGLTGRVSHDIVVGSQDFLKIVLTWGAEPSDLDSHLYTPEIEGSTYHIYYADRGSLEEPPYAWLDIDDITSYGPETIWFERIFPGTYTYSVYNFSGSPQITTSTAHVEVIDGQGVIAAFDIPTSGSGRWWNVFSLNGTTGNITEINTISDSGTATVPSGLQAPTLTSPQADAVLDNNCDDSSDSIEWDFDWSDVQGATKYQIYVIHEGSANLVIDDIATSSSYHYSSAGYIVDGNRFDWTWKVRAGNDNDEWSEWSEIRYFDVEPLNTDCEGSSSEDNYEENDTLATAWHPGYNWEQTWLSSIDGLGVQADDDWYKIDVTSGYQRVLVDCQFTDSEGDIDIALYDSSGNRLTSSTSISDNESIDYTVSSGGTYYIRVYYGNVGNTYDLWWDDL